MGHLCRKENPTLGKGGGSNLSSLKYYEKFADSLLYFYSSLFFDSFGSHLWPMVIRCSTTIRTMLAPFWALMPADILSVDRGW